MRATPAPDTPAIEQALRHLVLTGLGTASTLGGLRERLTRAGAVIDEQHLAALLSDLVTYGLVRSANGRGGDDMYALTALGKSAAASMPDEAIVGRDLAELERLRTHLLGVVGHELRTPLTAIRTSVGLLQDSGVTPSADETHRLLSSIAVAAERMQRLATDVLDIARLRSGDARLQLSVLDGAELSRGVVEEMAPTLATKRQPLLLDIAARPLIRADRIRLRQVLVKLLTNAHRSGPARAEIVMRLETQGDDVIWSVVDRGPGIPQADLPRVFDRFFSSDTTKLEHSVAGLGLAIALAIARAHDGNIEVDTSPGSGSTFRLRMPLQGPRGAGR